GGKGQMDEIEDLDPALAAKLAKWDEDGALVIKVVPESPADVAGLQPGDVVVEIAGIWIDTPTTLVRLASRAEVGRDLELSYLRDGQVWSTWISAVDRDTFKP